MSVLHFWHCAWKVVLLLCRVKKGGKSYSRGKLKVLADVVCGVDGARDGVSVLEYGVLVLADILDVQGIDARYMTLC